jgi:UDP-N-acetylglucosamine acyltransferase
MSATIHPTAFIEEGAELDADAYVGPFCTVGPKVKIGRGTKLISHVSVSGNTEIGEDNTIHPFATIGQVPQDNKYNGEDTRVVIGNNNRIRECVTIHRGSADGDGDGITRVGDNNFLMAYVHQAHDGNIGNNTTMASFVALAGHVVIEDFVVIGGMVGIHQHCRIGEYSMLGGVSRFGKEVPPDVSAVGADNVKLYGLNSVALKRAGVPTEDIENLKTAYKILFREKLGLSDAMKRVQEELPYTEKIQHLIEFINNNKRGFHR